ELVVSPPAGMVVQDVVHVIAPFRSYQVPLPVRGHSHMQRFVVSTKAPPRLRSGQATRPRGETFSQRQAASRGEKVSPLGVEFTPSEAEGALGRDDEVICECPAPDRGSGA